MNMLKNRAFIISVIILAALGALSVLQGCKNAMEYSQDFQWDAAKALAMGYDPYEESLHPSPEFSALGYEDYYLQMEANQFPSLLVLLFPYTLLTPFGARIAWLVSNLFFTLAILFLLKRTFFKDLTFRQRLVLALLMIAGMPWRNQIGVGQHTLFSLAFFLLSVWLYERSEGCEGRSKRLLLTLACAMALSVSFFKYTLTAPLALYYVYRRRFDIPFLSAIPHLGLTLWAARHLDGSVADMIKKPLEVAAWLSGEGSIDVGRILSLLFPGRSSASMAVTVVLMALLFALMLIMKKDRDELVISVLTLWALVITYHRFYDFFVMIIPFCWLLKVENGRKPIAAGYSLTVIFIFFVVRLAGESTWSVVLAAVLYYIMLMIFQFYALADSGTGRRG